jgi:hypothetical protein
MHNQKIYRGYPPTRLTDSVAQGIQQCEVCALNFVWIYSSSSGGSLLDSTLLSCSYLEQMGLLQA